MLLASIDPLALRLRKTPALAIGKGGLWPLRGRSRPTAPIAGVEITRFALCPSRQGPSDRRLRWSARLRSMVVPPSLELHRLCAVHAAAGSHRRARSALPTNLTRPRDDRAVGIASPGCGPLPRGPAVRHLRPFATAIQDDNSSALEDESGFLRHTPDESRLLGMDRGRPTSPVNAVCGGPAGESRGLGRGATFRAIL